MIFIDGEFNNLMIRLREQLQELLIEYPNAKDEDTVKGIIGEKFVGYCIGHSLWKLGYCLELLPYPRSYFLTRKYGCNANGHGGMDYLLTIVDEKEIQHKFLIEVKNWGRYRQISRTLFIEAILNRFTRIDPNNEYPRVVTMNTRNVQLIELRCRRNNIQILPIAEHITPESIGNDDVLQYLFNSFIDAFCTFITTAVPEDAYPYLDVENRGVDRTAGIIQDILMGVSYEIIMLRYGVTRGYIMRLASYIRSFGISLPDRRFKDWKIQWEIQE